ncbi:recombinase family protein [Tritonibacter mobilis]|uniref:recombinase family protein n=1 Tax=Tritonibacter mobilis TaxID=379347 RepID=UPI0008069D77|nr:recombinase family protein [Tritonibacter mobilis]
MTQDKPRLLFGYARVSTDDQNLDMQIDALVKYGVERDRILTDKASGSTISGRPGFQNTLKAMRPGAALVVWRLDRLGRNLSELIFTADLLRKRDAQLISLNEHLDTSTATGKMMFHLIGMFAQFERDLISERTKAGLAARRANGKSLGRQSIMAPGSDERMQVVSMLAEGKSIMQISKEVGISKSKLYNERMELEAEASAMQMNEIDRTSGSI